MDRPGLIDAFVEQLAGLGREAGIDATRLAAEVADHLTESVAGYRSAGIEHGEAERRAVEAFGNAEALVAALAAEVKGGRMARTTRFTRIAATTAALIASAVLAGIHMDWDAAAAGTPVQLAVVAAGVVLGISLLALAAAHIRTVPERPAAGRVVAWGASWAALGTLSAWGGTRLGGADINLGGRPFLASVGLLALLVTWASRSLHLLAGTGLGMLNAGGLALLLNGALSGTWRPLGAIGEGQANLGIELILIGWLLLVASWAGGPRGIRARAGVGRSLMSLGRRLAPTPPRLPQTESGANP